MKTIFPYVKLDIEKIEKKGVFWGNGHSKNNAEKKLKTIKAEEETKRDCRRQTTLFYADSGCDLLYLVHVHAILWTTDSF